MRIVAMMPTRGDQWILPLAIKAVLRWADHLVLFEHCPGMDLISGEFTQTREFLRTLGLRDRITYVVCNDPEWNELAHRQSMIIHARERGGATHLAIVDSDEVATEPLIANVRGFAEQLQPGQILSVPMVNLRHGWNYHASGMWADRQVSLVWKDAPNIRYNGDRFHAREPIGTHIVHAPNAGTMAHFWGFSERRLIEKHKLYRVTESLRWPHKSRAEINEMYGWATKGRPEYGDTPDTWKFLPVPEEWITSEDRALVDVNDVPWQEEAVRKAIAEHGIERFAGLDLTP